MMTPERYFDEHPDVAVLAWDVESRETDLFGYNQEFTRYPNSRKDIDWTGYDRKIAYNPNFAWGKRREIEWRSWSICENNGVPFDTIEQAYERVDLPDGVYAYRFGRYVDAPAEKPAPELSRFLPEGWEWKHDKDFGWGAYSGDTPKVMMCDTLGAWHYFNLLHPSEGGGFQRHVLGTILPERYDIIFDGGHVISNIENSGSPFNPDSIGFRPHFEKGGES